MISEIFQTYYGHNFHRALHFPTSLGQYPDHSGSKKKNTKLKLIISCIIFYETGFKRFMIGAYMDTIVEKKKKKKKKRVVFINGRWCISWLGRSLHRWHFVWCCLSEIFKLRMIITSVMFCIFASVLITLNHFQGHRRVQDSKSYVPSSPLPLPHIGSRESSECLLLLFT